MDIIEKINSIDEKKLKETFIELLKSYLNPAFGSMPKRDFDILLLMKLQELQVFNKDPEIYDIVSSLKVTRAKARNLLYEINLRNTSEMELDNKLRELIIKPIFLKENDKIALEVGNPYLTDHLRAKLKKIGHITDGSFSPELIKLTKKAYISLFEYMLPDNKKDEIIKKLIECGIQKDTTFKGFMTGMLKTVGKKIADDAGDEIGENIGEYLGLIMKGPIDQIKDKILSLQKKDNSDNNLK